MSNTPARAIVMGLACALLACVGSCTRDEQPAGASSVLVTEGDEAAPTARSSGTEYNPEVHAAGELTLIAELGPTGSGEQRRQANAKLAEILRGLNAAPVPARLFPRVPKELTAQVPPRADTTPDVPDAPEGLESPDEGNATRGSRIAGGELAAATYGVRARAGETRSGPVRVLVAAGPKGHAQTHTRELVEDVTLGRAGSVIFDDGAGLVVLVEDQKALAGDPKGRSWLFTLHAPAWQPRPIAISDGEVGPLRLAGETVDGSAVYFRNQIDSTLWRLTPATGELQNVATGHYQGSLIPSPDGRLLAVLFTAVRFSMDPSRTPARGYASTVAEIPARVIDTETGQFHTVTWRDGGYYLDQPVAWSADVPNRLYFTDAFNKLWQLDLKLDEASAKRYRQEEADLKARLKAGE